MFSQAYKHTNKEKAKKTKNKMRMRIVYEFPIDTCAVDVLVYIWVGDIA